MDNSRKDVVKDKSYTFALRIVNVFKYLSAVKREFVLSKQLLRSGTSIGANVAEAKQAQSRADFISKLSIALKESVETEYWINLLQDSKYLTEKEAESLLSDCVEIVRLLTAILKTTGKVRH
jgi:four helix bundle protein